MLPPPPPPAPAEAPTPEQAAPAEAAPAPDLNAPAKLTTETPMTEEESEAAFGSEDGLISARELSAAQAIAELERSRRKKQIAVARTHITNLMTYEYTGMKGKSEADVLRDAGVRALVSTASRLYFDDYILIGRDLLDPYLRQYGDRFLTSRTITKRRILADGTVELDVRVGVNVEDFYADLENKHFVGKPQVRPVIAVVLEESVDGEKSGDGRGRKMLEELLKKNEMRVESQRMGPHPLNVDVTASDDALRAARDEAQRGDVEVIVSGKLTVVSRGKRDILYDEFTIYDADIQLSLIRVDTGETLATASERFSAPALAGKTALDRTFEGLMPRSAATLSQNLLNNWKSMMLDSGDYRLMVTNINQEQLESVFNLLKTLSPDVDARVKAFFGDVAVINVYFPGSKPGQVEQFLRKSRLPQFQVRPADERRFELRIL
ncbi:hypothetical protein HYR69_00235 [Candidatus Sumerlaeota bacterium]|nr:hypothetical protein [Candidatus Sumerlaeota bacterium]